jgi:tRNA/rRNA methyltransferase
MRTRFILIQTSHAGNVGGVARAMKVMGFDDLVLVAAALAQRAAREETIQRASGANDVLAKARMVDTLDEALDGMTHLCATAMTPRDFGPPTRAPREHFADWAAGGRRMPGAPSSQTRAWPSCSAPSASACATRTCTAAMCA